ncbi:MAG: LysR family transcriptional regulator [Oscillospiraceae bacterium]
MTTQEMKCILMLAETLNFSKSALELNITQPAFSRMIVRAEEELGFKVFLRNTRTVELSREGEAFIISLRKAFAIFNSGIEHSRDMLREGKSLNITCAAEFVCLELAPYVLEFKKEHPDIFVECIPTATENIPGLLRNKQADLCFIFADRERFNSDFGAEVIKKIPLHLLVNKENPLSQKDVLEPKDLEHEKIIVLQTNAGAYEIGSYGAPLFILNKRSGLHLKESEMAVTTQECLIRTACNQGVCFFASTLDYLVPPNCVLKKINGVDFNFIALWNKGGISKWAQMFLNRIEKDENDDLCLKGYE